jgi:ankyrin repeat protein
MVERDDGRTVLWCGEGGGHEAVVKLLVERNDVGADSKDESGRMPLSWAARERHEAVVNLYSVGQLAGQSPTCATVALKWHGVKNNTDVGQYHITS